MSLILDIKSRIFFKMPFHEHKITCEFCITKDTVLSISNLQSSDGVVAQWCRTKDTVLSISHLQRSEAVKVLWHSGVIL